jgi:hypothetical protein
MEGKSFKSFIFFIFFIFSLDFSVAYFPSVLDHNTSAVVAQNLDILGNLALVVVVGSFEEPFVDSLEGNLVGSFVLAVLPDAHNFGKDVAAVDCSLLDTPRLVDSYRTSEVHGGKVCYGNLLDGDCRDGL